MKHCSLGHGRQCFVKALDHHICSQICCWNGKIVRESEMSTVGFIHDQRNSIFVDSLRNLAHIWNHAIISRRCNKYCFDFRIFLKISFHTGYGNWTIYPQIVVRLWINICGNQFPEVYCVVNSLVTVSGHQNLSTLFHRCGNGSKNSCCTSVDTKKTFPGAVHSG